MTVHFHGGPRDGEQWPHQCPEPGRYWIDRTIREYGKLVAYRSDLYELRTSPKRGWYYVTTREGHTSP